MKFNLLYEEVLSKSLNMNDFKYKFSLDTQTNKLTCKFQSIDKSTNKLIFITASIYNNTIDFSVKTSESNNEKKYTDKEFLMAYYKEYHNFKTALKIYKKDPEFFNSKQNQSENNTPKIESLNEVLEQEDTKDNGITLTENGIPFTFKPLNKSDIKNLISCSFILDNTSKFKASEDLQEYYTIIITKISELNSKIIKVQLYDNQNYEESTSPVLKQLSQQEFKQNYKSIYYSFQNALDLYEKHFQKSSIQNI